MRKEIIFTRTVERRLSDDVIRIIRVEKSVLDVALVVGYVDRVSISDM